MTSLRRLASLRELGDILSADNIPKWVVAALARLPQHRLQTVTTNIPGPQQPQYLCGRRMLEIFPYVPLALDVRIGVAICSYDGTLGFGITGDGKHATDIPTLADGIEHELAQLLDRATPTRPPAPARPRRRSTRVAAASQIG